MKTPPLISSRCSGPLGIVHLPRMWAKALLHTNDSLPEGYWCATKGFDAELLDALGLDAQDFLAYVRDVQPDYPTLEAWLRPRAENRQPYILAAAERILNRDKPPDRAAADRKAVGLEDESICRGLLLNDLDDWQGLHSALLGGALSRSTRFVAALSSRTAGPLGALHLPRFWLRSLLSIAGMPVPGPAAGALDHLSLTALGVDRSAVIKYLRSSPTYVEFEGWIRNHAQRADQGGVAAHNADLAQHARQMERDDLREWAEFHASVVLASATTSEKSGTS